MNLKFATISENPSQEEIKKEIDRLQHLANDFNNLQMSVKIFINSMYGATASPYFVGFNQVLSEAITLQGQDIIKFSAKIANKYFKEYWHKDKQLHNLLGIEEKVFPVINDVTIYGDTDSCEKTTKLHLEDGREISFEDFYNENEKNGSAGETLAGHESVKTKSKVLNWNKEDGLFFEKPQRIIRHKVTKEKWMLKTKTGKQIEITNDHSLIVFRNGEQIKIKPINVNKGDKILKIEKN